jgi:hypothetical protein
MLAVERDPQMLFKHAREGNASPGLITSTSLSKIIAKMKQTAPYLKHHDLSFQKDHSMEALASSFVLNLRENPGIDRETVG